MGERRRRSEGEIGDLGRGRGRGWGRLGGKEEYRWERG